MLLSDRCLFHRIRWNLSDKFWHGMLFHICYKQQGVEIKSLKNIAY
jgi:hypothetical protein